MSPHGMGHGDAAPASYLRRALPQALLRLIADKKVDVEKLMVTIIPQTGRKSVDNAQVTPRKDRSPVSIGRIQLLHMR